MCEDANNCLWRVPKSGDWDFVGTCVASARNVEGRKSGNRTPDSAEILVGLGDSSCASLFGAGRNEVLRKRIPHGAWRTGLEIGKNGRIEPRTRPMGSAGIILAECDVVLYCLGEGRAHQRLPETPRILYR